MRNKLSVFVFIIILSLIVSFGIAWASEYIVEEGAVCGNGALNTGEGCDDGNIINGDGCSSSCQIESGYNCSGAPSVCSLSGGGGGGGGGAVGDTTPPSISDIKESISVKSASISWKTNESSLSWVVYGLTTDYGKEVKTSVYTTSHLIAMLDLSLNTLYHYKIKSQDSRGNIGFSNDRIFTTGQMTIEELRAKIAEILAMIAELQRQLAQLRGTSVIPSNFKFERNLKLEQNLEDVKYLQIFLNSDPVTQLKVKPGAWGSPGKESIHFGSAVKDAVIRFQEKYGSEILTPWKLIKGTGFVGPATRVKINKLLGRE